MGLDAVDDSGDDLLCMGLADILTEGLLNGFNEVKFAAHGFLFWVLWVCVCV